jgi:hypothetical protein
MQSHGYRWKDKCHLKTCSVSSGMLKVGVGNKPGVKLKRADTALRCAQNDHFKLPMRSLCSTLLLKIFFFKVLLYAHPFTLALLSTYYIFSLALGVVALHALRCVPNFYEIHSSF